MLVLQGVIFGPERVIPVQMHLISAQLDTVRAIDDLLSREKWVICMNALDRVVHCLRRDERLVLSTRRGEDMAAMAILAARERKAAKELKAEKKAAAAAAAERAMADAEEEGAGDGTEAEEAARAAAKKAEEDFERKRKIAIPVVGDLGTNLIRLALEFTKNLRKTDPHTDAYVALLRDEAKLLSVAEGIQSYYEQEVDPSLAESTNDDDEDAEDVAAQDTDLDGASAAGAAAVAASAATSSAQDGSGKNDGGLVPRNIQVAARIALLRVQHLYYKHSSISKTLQLTALQERELGMREFLHPACLGSQRSYDEVEESKQDGDAALCHPGAFSGTPKAWLKVNCKGKGEQAALAPLDATIDRLCKLMYAVGDSGAKVDAMLMSIYFHALHERFYEARDLLLMSHLQDSIMHTEIPTQVSGGWEERK